ncbi:MAG: hypothetical protein DWQ34_24345 [Planctomycetota bacterium]|nr:MAG: hypothetical protein DWQ29_18460 [Planctomycetota bacterium]REJ87778.1 MAG: hypothetical protein DWQ34_24345 [Planctomycetota bacterium]REK27862.1 MAG: hypothetical protein DWQ41_07095 [Planctomycetota bacterium]REK32826.1 MAG: hypothetical protein DWQ45_16590 [Planctomycetota bacterium]
MTDQMRQALHRLAEQLPDDASWDDVVQAIFVCSKIEAGLKDVEEGRLLTDDEVFAEFTDAPSSSSL